MWIGHTFWWVKDLSIFLKTKNTYTLTQQFHSFRKNPTGLLMSMCKETCVIIFIAAFKKWGSSISYEMISKIWRKQNAEQYVSGQYLRGVRHIYTRTCIWKGCRTINTYKNIWTWTDCLWHLIPENSLSYYFWREELRLGGWGLGVGRKLTFPLNVYVLT